MRDLIRIVENAILAEAPRRRKARLKQPYSDVKLNPDGSHLIYHWIDIDNDRWSDIEEYHILPEGDWFHKIPGIGAKSGVSFAYNPEMADSGDQDNVCFVLDRRKVPNEIWDIPMEDVYNYTLGYYDGRHGMQAGMAEADPDEAFALGDVPLDSLVGIIIKSGASKMTRDRVAKIAQTFNVAVKVA